MTFRSKWFNKLSQMPAGTSTSAPTGNPPIFIASSQFPSINAGYSQNNVAILNQIATLLNFALYYNSNGKITFLWLKNQNFSVDSSGLSPDLKKIVDFCKVFYFNLLSNNGGTFANQLQNTEILAKKSWVLKSAALNNIPTATEGPLLSKIGGNLKQLIIERLTYLS